MKCEEAVGGLPEPELELEPDPEPEPDLVESGVGGGVGPGVGGSAVGSNTMLIEKDSKISRSTADKQGPTVTALNNYDGAQILNTSDHTYILPIY